MISFKTTAGAIAAIQKHTYKIVSFGDATGGRLRVDAAATSGEKQDPSKQGRRSILIYKSSMYSEASLDPENALSRWTKRPGTSGSQPTLDK